MSSWTWSALAEVAVEFGREIHFVSFSDRSYWSTHRAWRSSNYRRATSPDRSPIASQLLCGLPSSAVLYSSPKPENRTMRILHRLIPPRIVRQSGRVMGSVCAGHRRKAGRMSWRSEIPDRRFACRLNKRGPVFANGFMPLVFPGFALA